MTKIDVKNRIEKLRAEIDHHRYLYHVLDQEDISQAALDSLKNELFRLEQEYPDLITKDSPTQRVAGQALDKFHKVSHSSRMISLADAFAESDMSEWEERNRKFLKKNLRFDYFVELKLDGLAIALRYDSGSLILGATRGDGQVGEDVSMNVRTIESIPLRLRIPDKKELRKSGLSDEQAENILGTIRHGIVEIRGEAIMTKKVFEMLNIKYQKAGKAQLANTRNGVAGSLRQLDSRIALERQLDFYAYGLATKMGLETREQQNSLVNMLGFKTVQHNKYCSNLREVFSFHQHWGEEKSKLPYIIDGVVVKVNNLAQWSELGVVGKGPRYMIAYKFAAEQATTHILDIVWQVGRTGILTPTAILSPVNVGGALISRSTLHNMDEIERLGLRIGDTVIIERSGDVIPKVIQVLTNLRTGKEKKIIAPKLCPNCNSIIDRIDGEVAYRCVNKNCSAVNFRRLCHWTSKSAFDIEGLGPKIIEQLVGVGLVNDVADFYSLKVGDLLPLERFAEKSAENLIRSLSGKKEIELARFIYALGIPNIGEESARALAEFLIFNFKFLNNVLISNFKKALDKLKLEDLKSIQDFGPVVAASVYEWFHDSHNLELLEKLDKNGVSIRVPKIKASNTALAGKTFVLTGSLPSLTRDEAKVKIRDAGGKISSEVSQKTDYVVAGEEAGSKLEKAQELGVKIIDEKELLRITHNA